MKIAYNRNDTPWGQDGTWIEARDGETLEDAIARAAAENAAACAADAGDDVDALADEMIGTLTTVDLSALVGLDDWDSLVAEWNLARRNGWTSAGADALMSAEIARRESPEMRAIITEADKLNR